MITEQQRQNRKLGIGGSDMPIILGLSKYKTPYQLYLEKTGQAESNQEETAPQYWGNRLEGIIRDEFAKRNNLHVEEIQETVVHPIYPYLLAHVDGYIPSCKAVVEIKSSNAFMANEWGESGTDTIPMQYLVQVAHYCAVMNADMAYIAVLIGGNDYREFKYTRNSELENMLLDAAQKFWHCVETKTPPAAINQVDLRLMFPRHNPEKIMQVKAPIAERINVLTQTKFKIKALSEIEEEQKFQIMQFMQDAECLVNEEGTPIISWKANKKGSRTFLVKGV